MGNKNGKASVIVKNSEEIEELIGNNNGKASVIVNDSEEKRHLVEGSSRSHDRIFIDWVEWDEWVESETEQATGFRYSPRPSRSVPKAIEGEQVAAGWPTWLSAVAAEAIQGWVPRTIDSFTILDKIGEGSYSTVLRARDMMHNRTVALKRMWFDNLDSESVRYAAREIITMRRLNHPNVINLEGVIALRRSTCLYLVLEYMEHDLAGLASTPNIKFREPQIKCYMQQLLCGLEHCHNRSVLHRDIKSSNLLVNNDGVLKIADFGSSSLFDPHQSVPLTSRVVTLRYRPPELLLGSTNYGVEVDLWSTGCVLGELYAGKPILKGGTEVEQLYKIFKLCGSPSEDYWRKLKLPHKTIFKPQKPYKQCLRETLISFPDVTVRLLETLLALDPESRGTASLSLQSEFFKAKPFACDPSSIPKYPINKATGREYRRRAPPVHVKRSDAKAELARLKQKSNLYHQVNIVQMLEEHICHIEEATWQARVENEKVGIVQAQEVRLKVDESGPGPSLIPSWNVDQLLEEHDRLIQESFRQKMLEKKRGVGKIWLKGPNS